MPACFPLLRLCSYQHLGDMMSLGTTSGAVTLPIPVPPPLSAVAQSNGPLGQLLRVAGVKLSGSYGGSSEGVTLEGPLAAAVSARGRVGLVHACHRPACCVV